MSESPVERVAKALREHDRLRSRGGWTEWERARPERRQKYLARARTAIEAFREPTEAMCDAGSDAHGVWGFGASDAGFVFPAMIDAALKE